MTDELDVLRHERDVIEPDPEFRADLMDRLRQQMADPDGAWHARVIDLDRPPLTASPLSAGGGAFRRRSSVWLAAAVVALFVAGVALVQSGEDAPDLATESEDDQALAELAMLTSDDVGRAWAPASSEEEAQHRADEDALADCLGPEAAELRAGRATATSVFVSDDNGNPEHFASTAFVHGSAADAHAVLDQAGLAASERCYLETIEQQILERARDGLTLITGRELAVDDLEVRSSTIERSGLSYSCCERVNPEGVWTPGYYTEVPDEHHAFQVKVTLGADDREVDVYRTLVFVVKGRVGVQLSIQTYYIPFGSDRGPGSLTNEILDRLPPFEASDPEGAGSSKPRLPAPGEQPADVAAAEEQVRLAYTGLFDTSSTREARSRFSERPAAWAAANRQLEEGPYGELVEGIGAEVDEVVFTDPTRATVRFRLDGVAMDWAMGRALLVDGRWVVAIETTCTLVATANVRCDPSL
jgi:hypothetical protein